MEPLDSKRRHQASASLCRSYALRPRGGCLHPNINELSPYGDINRTIGHIDTFDPPALPEGWAYNLSRGVCSRPFPFQKFVRPSIGSQQRFCSEERYPQWSSYESSDRRTEPRRGDAAERLRVSPVFAAADVAEPFKIALTWQVPQFGYSTALSWSIDALVAQEGSWPTQDAGKRC